MKKEFNKLTRESIEHLSEEFDLSDWHWTESDIVFLKEFIRQVEDDFELWKLKEFGINVCASPKFNKFIEKLRERAGDDLK